MEDFHNICFLCGGSDGGVRPDTTLIFVGLGGGGGRGGDVRGTKTGVGAKCYQ